MKRLWIGAAVLALVFGVAGYTIAQQAPEPPAGMMGPGMMGMMGQGMMGGPQGSGPMSQMSPEQIEQMAKMHGLSADQIKAMTEQCNKMMSAAPAQEQPAK